MPICPKTIRSAAGESQKVLATCKALCYAPRNSSPPSELAPPQGFPIPIATGFLYPSEWCPMKRLAALQCIGLAIALGGGVLAGAQTPSAFYKFGGGSAGDGDEPTAIIQAQDGNFYGITSYGGNASGCTDDQNNATGFGTIFRITPGGSETVLYKFSGAVG